MARFVTALLRNYSDRASYTTVAEVGLYDSDETVEEILADYARLCAGEPALVEEWREATVEELEDIEWTLSDLVVH